MRKIIALMAILVLMSLPAFAGTVARNMPSRTQPGQTLTVTLSITGATAGKLFTLEDLIPTDLMVKEWNVVGAQESKESISTRQQDNKLGWSFTPAADIASVEYKIDLPASEAQYIFGRIVWFDPNGQGGEPSQFSLIVANVVCGDSICEGAEDTSNCAQDCAAAPVQVTPLPEEPAKRTTMLWLVIGLIIVIGAFGYYSWQKKKKGSFSYHEPHHETHDEKHRK